VSLILFNRLSVWQMRKVNHNYLETMSRLFTIQRQSRSWEADCRRAIAKFGAVNSDIISVRANPEFDAHDLFVIVHNGEPESITTQKSEGVNIMRRYTDVYPNALKHFEDVTLKLRAEYSDVSIFVHPSDKGLVEYVNPVDARMYEYGITYSNIGQFVSCLLIECNIVNGDRFWHSCVGSITIDRCTCTPGRLGKLGYHSPAYISQEIAKELKTTIVPRTDIIRVYDTTLRCDPRTMCAQEDQYIIAAGGKCFNVKENNQIVLQTLVYATDVKEESLALDNTFGKHYFFEATSGLGKTFDYKMQTKMYVPAPLCCANITPYSTMKRILDCLIAFASLDLPVYIILWIADFLPGTQFVAHIKKVRYIEALKKSIRKVIDARVANKEQRLI